MPRSPALNILSRTGVEDYGRIGFNSISEVFEIAAIGQRVIEAGHIRMIGECIFNR